MSRVATAQELIYFRTAGQRSQLFLGLRLPATIYAAQVDGTPTGDNANFPNDMVGEVAFDNGAGTLGDVQTGMTAWIGTTAGAKDVGMCYIRKDPIAGTFYFGETSEIEWADDQHVTIVDDFQIWARHIKIVSGSPVMDFDVSYSDQHTDLDPMANLGGDVVLWRTGDTVAFAWDGSGSVVLGSSISGYQWSAPGASALTGDTTATPTTTYDADGQYVVYCEVTAANGKTFTGCRIVWVYSEDSMPETDFILKDCTLDFDDGGCRFSIDMPFDADLTEVLERTKVILFAKDWYGDTEISIGPEIGRENILAEGWITKESIDWDVEQDIVSFTVYGGQEWLKKIPAYPIGLELSSASAAWTSMDGLTVDRAMWHLLHWRSTFSKVGDMYLSGDTRYAKELSGASSSLWDQMREIGNTSIFATCGIDWFGAFYCMVEPQLVPTGDRSGWPTIQTITKQDWHDVMEIDRELVSPVSMASMSGVSVDVSGTAFAYFSLAHGHVFKHHGNVEIIDRLLLSSQSQANTLCGMYMGWKNNEIPRFTIDLACTHRLTTLWPAQYFAITIAAADTERGFAYDGNLIPRTVDYDFDAQAGLLLTSIWCEAETSDVLNIDGDIPVGDGTFVSLPPLPKLPKLPPLPPLDVLIPGLVDAEEEAGGPSKVLLHTSNFGFIYSVNFNTASPTWQFMNSGLTDDQKVSCRRVIKTPNGALFAAIHDSSTPRGFEYLFYASGLGAPWILVKDLTGVTGQNAKFTGLGFNPNVDEEVAIGAGSNDIFNISGFFYIGDSSGMSQTASGIDARLRYGDISFLDKWFHTHSENDTFTSGAWSRYSAAGAAEINSRNWLIGTLNDRQYFHKPAGNGNIYAWLTSSSPRIITGNDGDTAATFNPAPQTLDGFPCALAVDPTGQYLMGGTNTGVIGQRSSDFASTWGNVNATLSVGYRTWENHGTPNAFSAFTTQVIKYTPDFGDTWIDKSGNLATVASLCAARQILHVDW